ncbi:MAG TPA: CocE/NonD family hydrolase [Myxococcota bacterium]|nr:CocE/NonD family hydrolase [Myxococcota bacterium]
MAVAQSPPHAVREIEHTWIPLRDGTRLAARIWLPESAAQSPVPAVIEYIPYGKRIGTRERDEAMHAWFAGHGLAALRVDLRGAGESDGVLLDEYLPREQQDGAELIAWAAAQPWCSGAVGLIGKSWGGFNALQIAARRPPALRGIITACSTDDRYADDVHYMGGCLLNDNLWWGGVFFQLCAQPPDPELAGADWRARWQERLEAAYPHPLRWLQHPLRDDYWRQGSVCEDYSAIACPVYAVGGWADAYSNAIPRLLAGVSTPRWGLVGPWGHAYPHEGIPGPAIGFLQDALGWWNSCLRGALGAEVARPFYRVWMPESALAGDGADRPGRWVSESTWPSPRIEPRILHLARGRLGPPGPPARLEIRSPQRTGRAAGAWLNAALRDQREDDADSLCFDAEPFRERTELLGAPELRLVVSSDQPAAFVAARLCDVAPDGTSIRVSYGLWNLTHAPDHASWTPLVPGQRREVRFRLNDAAHGFAAGHRLRLALSNAYWPLVWPSPVPAALTVYTEECQLVVPVRPPDPGDAHLPAFAPPERAPHSEWTPLGEARFDRRTDPDAATGDLVTATRSGYDAQGRVVLGRHELVGMEGGDGMAIRTRIHPADPVRARAAIEQRTELRRGEWSVAVETEVEISCTRDVFRVEARLAASAAGRRVFERRWDETAPRMGI